MVNLADVTDDRAEEVDARVNALADEVGSTHSPTRPRESSPPSRQPGS
jgi:hypothetical protein